MPIYIHHYSFDQHKSNSFLGGIENDNKNQAAFLVRLRIWNT